MQWVMLKKVVKILDTYLHGSLQYHDMPTSDVVGLKPVSRLSPTTTLLEHTLLTRGFTGVAKAAFPCRLRRKTAILRGQIWSTHSSDVVGLEGQHQFLDFAQK